MKRPSRRGLRPRVEQLDDRRLLSIFVSSPIAKPALVESAAMSSNAQIASTPFLVPSQVRAAYGLNASPFTGVGQAIAIVDAFHDPYIQSDLNRFNASFGIAPTTLSIVNLAGNATDDGWASEEALDVEWAHALAPDAHIVVVEAPSDSLVSLMQAVNVARNIPGVSVISMSWGTNEFSTETFFDPILTTPAGHTGVSFVVATGDSGAFGGTQWPASSPNVVAVGGTSLTATSAGMTLGESAWTMGGGGISAIEREPMFQAAVQSSGGRTTPDVSADAGTPVVIFTTAPSTGVGGLQLVRGTSIATPIIAAILADADQGLAAAGLPTLDSGAQVTQFRLFLAQAAGAFHDVLSGFNGFVAQGGYDLASGLGTPNTPVLIASLVGSGMSSSSYPALSLAPIKATKASHAARHRPARRHDVLEPNTAAPGSPTSVTPPADAPRSDPAPSAPPPVAAPPNVQPKNAIPQAAPPAQFTTPPSGTSPLNSKSVSETRSRTRDGELLNLMLELWGLDRLMNS
jgi:Subtilase family